MDVSAILRERQGKFVETRTRIEMEVNKFLESVDNTGDERILSIPGRPEGKTCREVLPALWVEPFNEEVYKQQLIVLQSYIDAVTAFCDKLNMEAQQRLQS